MNQPRIPALQSGFTLVELMIALLLGLFLLGGLLTLVQDNKRTFISQTALAQLQDSERLAMTLMTDVIQESGYFTDPTNNNAKSTMLALASPPMALGQSMTGTYSAAAPGDSITVRIATGSGDQVLNCMGGQNNTGSGFTYVNQFYVNGSQQLVCNLNGTVYPLVNGVTQLNVLYGVNSLSVGNNVDTYMTATQVAAANAWGSIIAVHVALTFTNPLYAAANPQGQSQTFTLQRQISVMNQVGL